MSQQIKYLPIEKSQLYRIGRKKDLARLLNLDIYELKKLSQDANFKEWYQKKKGKSDRLIEEPLPILSNALSRLHNILRKVETPDYLLSGKRKIKPQNNAEMHIPNTFMITVDIDSFYQSTKREFVYRTFVDTFGQTEDVASLLASLTTYKGHIPTGAATSQLVAYWAYKKTFDRIHKLSMAQEVIMSVWVDDITFSSSSPFPLKWTKDIKEILSEVDLRLKVNKTKKYCRDNYKIVTGSVVSPKGEIKVKNKMRKEVLDLLKYKRVEDLSLKETRQLFGKLISQRQNEEGFFENIFLRCKIHLKKLENKKI